MDANDKRLPLDKMNIEHLENTIKAFPGHDTKPLRQALRRREPAIIERVLKMLRRDERSSKVKPKQQKRAERAIRALSRYLEGKN